MKWSSRSTCGREEREERAATQGSRYTRFPGLATTTLWRCNIRTHTLVEVIYRRSDCQGNSRSLGTRYEDNRVRRMRGSVCLYTALLFVDTFLNPQFTTRLLLGAWYLTNCKINVVCQREGQYHRSQRKQKWWFLHFRCPRESRRRNGGIAQSFESRWISEATVLVESFVQASIALDLITSKVGAFTADLCVVVTDIPPKFVMSSHFYPQNFNFTCLKYSAKKCTACSRYVI